MTRRDILLIHWCEIDGEPTRSEKELTLPITATEDEIIKFLREENDEEYDPDNTGEGYYWRMAGFGRTENTATIEWRSGRGHLAITVVVWFIDRGGSHS